MTDTAIKTGGWTLFRELDDADIKLFNSLPKPLGVDYTPIQVMSQVVAGVNYRFWCDTKTVTKDPLYGAAVVAVYVSPDGAATLGPITPIQ